MSQQCLLTVEKENAFLCLFFFISCLGLIRFVPMDLDSQASPGEADVCALTGSSRMSAMTLFSFKPGEKVM